MDELLGKYTPFIQKYKIPLSLGFLGMILFGYGLISSSARQNSDDIKFVAGPDSKTAVKSAEVTREITIDVSGAVMSPGVYKLTDGSRVDDALIKAGGMSADADRELVAKQINLAAKLVDGSKVYIPKIGESTTGTTSTTGYNTSGLININSASASDLDTLPGIGQVTAQKIIDNRPYQAIEELLNKKVVTKSVFEKIKEKIGLY
jgi:competence protein ComEA